MTVDYEMSFCICGFQLMEPISIVLYVDSGMVCLENG